MKCNSGTALLSATFLAAVSSTAFIIFSIRGVYWRNIELNPSNVLLKKKLIYQKHNDNKFKLKTNQRHMAP